MTPEQKARVNIDALLQQAGWHVCDMAHANIHASRGVALREFPLNAGYGFADYLLYIDGKAAGVIEAKKEGATLTGVEVQSARYAQGLPASLPAWVRPLPFSYESTGIETHFTQGLDPEPRARSVFAFHRPDTLAAFLKEAPAAVTVRPEPVEGRTAQEPRPAYLAAPTFLGRLQTLPPLKEDGLWPAQIIAIRNLENSLKANKPRALIQMATGSGKTFTSISFIYRLIKFAGARRVLFLVDRGNLGRQTKKEFDQYNSPYNNYKFGEEYIVQHLQSNQLDTTARVTICTIQRLFSMLKGRELAPEDDEQSVDGLGKPLADLAEAIQYGYTAKARSDSDGIRYLRITDIQDDQVDWRTVPSCDVGDAESEKYLLSAGDLVFARTGATVGKSFLLRGNVPKAVFASYLIRVKLRSHIDPRYVAYFFRSPAYWSQIAESSAGIGQPNVNGKKLAQIRIPVAPPEQQQEIVAELEKQFSRLDEAVANLQRVKANLKRYKASVLKDAVEGRLVPTEAELARRDGRTFETGDGAQLDKAAVQAVVRTWMRY